MILDLFDNLIGSRTSPAFFGQGLSPTLQNAILQGSCLEAEVSKQLYVYSSTPIHGSKYIHKTPLHNPLQFLHVRAFLSGLQAQGGDGFQDLLQVGVT